MDTKNEQPPLLSLTLDISGEPQSPVPQAVSGNQCSCCGFRAHKLWQGARAGQPDLHDVCTLCYLTGHLDSPTAAHGRLAFLPGMSMTDVHHLQRRALLAMLGGDGAQRQEGERIWKLLLLHAHEVKQAWGTARASEFAVALKRLPPHQRSRLQARLSACALIVPADRFDDLTLLLPAGKTVAAALASPSWNTYTRSDLYVEHDPLD